MKSKFACLVIVVSVLVALRGVLISEVQGAVIATRGELLSRLGAGAVTEDFETFQFPTNTAKRVGRVLDAGSVVEGQGPGLVRPGLRFIQSPPDEGLQWDRQFQYGLQSAAMVADFRLIVDFTNQVVTHVGLDMFWFQSSFPLASPGTVQVLATNDVTLLYTTNIFEPFAPASYFFGFTHSSGIGRLVLFRQESEGLSVSPIIDNLTFGFVPSLSIASSGGQVSLSWPQAAAGYQLEATTNVAMQGGWVTVTNVPVPINGQNTVTLLRNEAYQFFRLHGP